MAMTEKKIRKNIFICLLIVCFTFTCSFALIPFYNSFCRATGFGGRVNLSQVTNIKSTNAPDIQHLITMQFVTTNNANLAWDFYPKKNSLSLYPETNNKMIFVVKNNTKKTMTVQAVPSITPWQAARHLHKIQCFCFTQQTLKPGESLDMPVVFRFDKDLPKEIKTVTLSYALFDVTDQKKRKIR